MTDATVAPPPQISPENLSEFHAAHFSTISGDHFSNLFLGPVEDSLEEGEDDLGYYSDGVKRTLTDEQIAIFRHSEIQAIIRDRRHAEEARECESSLEPGKALSDDGELEDEEVKEDKTVIETPTSVQQVQRQRHPKKIKKSRKSKQKSFYKQHVKPDLRKRTWDKVGAGMDSLTYDDENGTIAGPSQQPQRRRITYNDD